MDRYRLNSDEILQIVIFDDLFAQKSQQSFLEQKKKSAYNRNLVWVYVVSESSGIGCMAMFVAFPSTIMEAAFGRLHNNGAGAFGTRPIAVDSIVVGGGTYQKTDLQKPVLPPLTAPPLPHVQTD